MSFMDRSLIAYRSRREKYLDISFESEHHNVYDPYFSSEPSDAPTSDS
jgi:hypothetical protein